MKFAYISNNQVVSIAEYSSEEEAASKAIPYQAVINIDQLDPQPTLGWELVDGVLIDPSGQSYPLRHLSREKFLSRFTEAELIGIEAFSTQTNPYAVALRVAMRKQQVAEYIDLDYHKTISGVQNLVALGLLTAERANEILTAPLKEEEKIRR